MPRLSIIIPVLGDPIQLENTLVSVLENIPDQAEVVVVLNQPYNDPYNLKDEVQFVLAPPRTGLAGMANAALAQSDGSIVHLLIAGVEVGPNWTDSVIPLFDDPSLAVVAPLAVEKSDPDRVASAGVDYSAGGTMRRLSAGKSASRLGNGPASPLGADVAAGFYRRAALDAVGGFSEGVGDNLSGVDLAIRLKRAGFTCALEPECSVFVDSAALPQQGAFARGYGLERFFWRWAPCYGWKGSILRHAFTVAGAGLACVVRPSNVLEIAGRFFGSMTLWSHRGHWRSLEETPCGAARGSASRPHFAARADSVQQLETPSVM